MSPSILVVSGADAELVASVVRPLCERSGFESASAQSDSPDSEWGIVGSSDADGASEEIGPALRVLKADLARVEAAGETAVVTVSPDRIAALPERPDLTAVWLHSDVSYEAIYAPGRMQPTAANGTVFDDARPRLDYDLIARDGAATADLLELLVRFRERSGVLTGGHIRAMTRCGLLVLNPDDGEHPDDVNISGASYDLSLGDEYYYGGLVRHLSKQSPHLIIGAYDYAIVTSRDIMNLPRDVTARFDLSNTLFCQGIVLSNGPQVDPGFSGVVMCLLFNTSNANVRLRRGQHYATIEFHKTMAPTKRYQGPYQRRSLVDYLPSNPLEGGINQLKRELEAARNDARNLQALVLAVITLIFAIVAVVLATRGL